MPTALVGVVGEDIEGASVLRQAFRDGIDVSGVVRRGTTALLVDLVDEPASRRLFEHVPPSALVTVEDLDRSLHVIDAADTVSLQLQQRGTTMLTAARRARMCGARVVADGRPDPDVSGELLRLVHVIRMDAKETELFAGKPATTVEAATTVAHQLLEYGPQLAALAVPHVGDLFVWPTGSHLFPLSDAPVIDLTGAGDSFMAGLIAALRRDSDPVRAGTVATAAAGATVQRLGGRPDLIGFAV